MPHLYEIRTGRWFHDGALLGIGYAGHPPHVNDVSAIGIRGVGPLPPGGYALGNPTDSPEVGLYAMHLVPDAPTRAYIISLGRDPDSFWCHGDDIQHAGEEVGSDGCIVQLRRTRNTIGACVAKNDNQLSVVTCIPIVTDPELSQS